MLESVDFFLHCFGFVLVQAMERMDKLDLFHHEKLTRLFVHSRVNFASGAFTEQPTLLPSDFLTKNLGLCGCFGVEEVVFFFHHNFKLLGLSLFEILLLFGCLLSEVLLIAPSIDLF